MRRLWESPFVRWSGFSVFSFAVVVGLTYVLGEIVGLHPNLAFLIPLVIAYFMNFATCRWFVYRSSDEPIVRQFLKYSATAVGFRVVEYAIYWALVNLLDMRYMIAVFIVLPTSFVCKYLFYKVAVFAKRAPSDESVPGEAIAPDTV